MDRRIRRISLAVGMVLALATMTASVALAGKPTPPPPPTPPYATLSIDAKCHFTIVGAWTEPFAAADAQLHMDGAFLLTVDTNGGVASGTIDATGTVVTWNGIALAKSRVAHPFYAIVDIYAANGVALAQLYTNTVTAKCAPGA